MNLERTAAFCVQISLLIAFNALSVAIGVGSLWIAIKALLAIGIL